MGEILETGQAHVWVLEIAVEGVLTANDYEGLSDDERALAGRFVREQDRTRYVRAHVELRRLLAGYIGCDPRHLRIEKTAKGKPYLSGSRLHFNLSHSGRCVAVGICAGSAIGVDVEEIRPNPECREIARVHFAPHEFEWMNRGSDEQQLERFYQLWTVKEAFVKATGAGVAALATPLVTDEWNVTSFGDVEGYAAAAVVAKGVSVRWRTRVRVGSHGNHS